MGKVTFMRGRGKIIVELKGDIKVATVTIVTQGQIPIKNLLVADVDFV